ncbi:MAG: MFS transporter [Gammaproteobacteria bacterium]
MTMLFLGFSAGIPLLLIFSSLSLWLREAGIERSAVTFFSWAALGYSFKFVWAPLVDTVPLPFLHRLLGRRRSWLLLAQLAIIAAIVLMSLTDPAVSEHHLNVMALAAVMLGFSAATQDIVIDAYRIESADKDLQALLSSTYIAGYRVGMLVSGAGALFLASAFGSVADDYNYLAWQSAYLIIAATMLVGVVTTLLIPEPEQASRNKATYSARDYAGFLLLFLIVVISFVGSYILSADWMHSIKMALQETVHNKPLASLVTECLRISLAIVAGYVFARILVALGLVNREILNETYIAPVQDFFMRYGVKLAILFLMLIGLYRISDIVLGVISNVFYQDMGFSKVEIATIVKTFGLFMTIAGGFLGGILSMRYGVMRILLLGAVLSAATNLLFLLLSQTGYNISLLYLVISADNLSAGLASAAFVAFLSSLTNVSFTAMQYAIFSSLMTLIPKVLGGYSGGMVDAIGYAGFFTMTALMGLPVILLIWLVSRYIEAE